jgi:hypothetical protein
MRRYFVAGFAFIGLVFCSLLFCNTAYPSPTFDVSTSSNTAEKGHTFQIFVEIKTIEPLHDIVISLTEPEGFYVQAVMSPGITIVNEEKTEAHGIAQIKDLGQNSSITASFKVWAPDSFGNPKTGKKKSLYSTRAPKTFPINIFYKSESGSVMTDGSYTTKVSIRYTTSIGLYLIAGLLGVLLGFIVKIATQYKQEISESVKGSITITEKIRGFFFQILIERLPLLLTLLIVGFGILLSLAKHALPVTSWHQAIALGIGIGILSDEQLITKIKKIKV